MKKLLLYLMPLILPAFIACGSKNTQKTLFVQDGDLGHCTITGNVAALDGVMTITGAGSSVVFDSGNYRDFILAMDVMTADRGKGEIYFHTDKALSKGYSVAINNDTSDPQWWKMTGSLLSVRNLTKSFVPDGQWFSLNVIVSGNYIRIEIGGEPVVEYYEPDQPYRTDTNSGKRLSEGLFAVASTSDGVVKLKNVTVTVPEKNIYTNKASFSGPVDETTDEIIRLHQEDFPVLDYHVHLKGGLTREQAAIQSRRTGINYAVAPNCGIGFTLTNDAEVLTFLDTMRTEPFILAMQAEGREWITTFSPEVRAQFDYVFTDALTFTDSKGRRTRLWIPEETWIEDEQQYMDLIVDKIIDVLKEPVDIYVNPCFLPEPMDERYDYFWTEARMDRFVAALAASGKALEINELYNIPNKAIIQKAKAAGVKFTFGTNNVVPEVSMLEYGIRMKKECGLTAADMYKPKIKIQPVNFH